MIAAIIVAAIIERELYMATIIACVSQKGGVGKSTLARTFAVEAMKEGINTHIADLDIQQATSFEWSQRRKDGKILPAISSATYSTAEAALQASEDYDLLIIDGPARTSASTLEIAKIADLIIQPSGSSKDDLNPAIRAFHELTDHNISKNKILIVLCRIQSKKQIAVAKAYIQDAGYNVLENGLQEKIGYQDALNDGKALTETKYDKLNEEALSVMKELVQNLQIIIDA